MSNDPSSLTELGARLAENSVSGARARYQDEVVALIEAAYRVQRHQGEFTVGEVLEESGLGTRAFYRHFSSKDELLLAMLEFEMGLAITQLAEKVVADPRSARHRLEAWVEWYLGIAFEPVRTSRFAVFNRELIRLHGRFPDRVNTLMREVGEPLLAILAAGVADGSLPAAEPASDAMVIGSVVRGLLDTAARGDLHLTRREARAAVLRFCLPALGAD